MPVNIHTSSPPTQPTLAEEIKSGLSLLPYAHSLSLAFCAQFFGGREGGGGPSRNGLCCLRLHPMHLLLLPLIRATTLDLPSYTNGSISHSSLPRLLQERRSSRFLPRYHPPRLRRRKAGRILIRDRPRTREKERERGGTCWSGDRRGKLSGCERERGKRPIVFFCPGEDREGAINYSKTKVLSRFQCLLSCNRKDVFHFCIRSHRSCVSPFSFSNSLFGHRSATSSPFSLLSSSFLRLSASPPSLFP